MSRRNGASTIESSLVGRGSEREVATLNRPTRSLAGVEHWTARVVAVLVGLPIFISVSAGGVGPPTGPSVAERGATIAVPISLLLIVGLIAVSIGQLRSLRFRQFAPNALFVFVVANAFALFYGGLTSQINFNSIAFFLQTLLPIFGYVFGSQLFRGKGRSVADTYRLIFLIPIVSLVGIALTTIAIGGRPWLALGTQLGPFQIPQILRYVPTVFGAAIVGYAHLWFQSSVRRFHRGLLIAVAVVLLSAVHSRTSLLILAAGMLIAVLVRPEGTRARRSTAAAWAVLAGVVLLAALPQLSGGPVALDRLFGDNEAAQLSSERRYEALYDSVAETFSTPFGRAYAANENLSLGGTESAFSRVTNSENQLGEFGLRAGPLAAIAVLLFLASTLAGSFRAIRRSPASEDSAFMMSVWVALSATLLIATFTQQPMSQPFPGLYLWLMLGLLRGWTKSNYLQGSQKF